MWLCHPLLEVFVRVLRHNEMILHCGVSVGILLGLSFHLRCACLTQWPLELEDREGEKMERERDKGKEGDIVY